MGHDELRILMFKEQGLDAFGLFLVQRHRPSACRSFLVLTLMIINTVPIFDMINVICISFCFSANSFYDGMRLHQKLWSMICTAIINQSTIHKIRTTIEDVCYE